MQKSHGVLSKTFDLFKYSNHGLLADFFCFIEHIHMFILNLNALGYDENIRCHGLFGMAKRQVIVSKTNPDRYDETDFSRSFIILHLIVFEMHLSGIFII